MKEKLLQLLAERKEIYMTELPELMPEIKGEYSMYMPVKEGINPNVLWLARVNKDFIEVFNELLVEKQIIDWEPQNFYHLMIDTKTIYAGIPLASKRLMKSKKECWMPMSIKLAGKQ